MLSSRTFIFLFFVLTALASVGSANGLFFWLRQDGGDKAKGGDGIDGIGNGIAAAASTILGGGAAAPTTTTDDSSTSRTDSSTSSPSSTPSKTHQDSSTSDASSSVASTTSASLATTAVTISDASGSPSTTLVVIQTSVVSGTKLVPVTHSISGASAAPTGGLASNDNSGSSGSGMSQNTKNIAIGVGVGVGGAIVLGGLALVAWRIWGRKKHNPEEDHFLMNDPVIEKSPTSTAASPFKSTLDQYHNPAGRLNTASNF